MPASIDADNDIQSCGGCWSDGSGEDCTLLLGEDGEGEVTCVKGVCHGELKNFVNTRRVLSSG